MKKFVCMALGVCMCAELLTGCGTSLDSDTSVVYVGKNGKIVSLDVEQLTESYYDAEELETFIDEHVSAYAEENGKDAVRVKKLEAEEETARLWMEYKTADDYSAFNGIELYQGKVIDALEAGYSFDGDFVKVLDGEIIGVAGKQEIYGEQDLKVAIIRANTDVQVEGEICYVTRENVKLTGADSISIREGYYLEKEALEQGTEIVGETEAAEYTVTEGAVPVETDIYTFIVYK